MRTQTSIIGIIGRRIGGAVWWREGYRRGTDSGYDAWEAYRRELHRELEPELRSRRNNFE